MANDLAAVSSHNVELREKVDTIPQLNVAIQVLNNVLIARVCVIYDDVYFALSGTGLVCLHVHIHTHQELQKNNEALLQMYGEKAEEAEELKLDIQDMKDMYKQQIDALTKR